MTQPLTIVGWLWKDPRCRTRYTPEHANIWARMIHRNLTLPHRFILMTDLVADLDPLIRPVALWEDWRDVLSPKWPAHKPQCYVRLKAFSEWFREIAGERFVSIDLDCVVKGNLDEILSRTEDFVIWRRAAMTGKGLQVGRYQGSMWMMTPGARKHVWENFHGVKSLEALIGKPNWRDFMIADQGWMLSQLGDEATWGMEDGVYDWRWLQQQGLADKPPDNARIVFFAGPDKPSDLLCRSDCPQWIMENYR